LYALRCKHASTTMTDGVFRGVRAKELSYYYYLWGGTESLGICSSPWYCGQIEFLNTWVSKGHASLKLWAVCFEYDAVQGIKTQGGGDYPAALVSPILLTDLSPHSKLQNLFETG
jgi:hypothetical protein